MWKAPHRPRENNVVTQNFGDGLVTVCTVSDAAKPGHQPVPELTPKYTLRYSEQRLGIQRYYSAAQNQIEVERVIRVPRAGPIDNQYVAITEDSRRYRIDLVQAVTDVYPPSLDLTLVKYDQGAEVSTP